MSLLTPPASVVDFRRRMNFVLIAEKFRLARRVLTEALELMGPGMPAEEGARAESGAKLADWLAQLGGSAAAEVSEDYAARYAEPLEYRRDDAGARFVQLLEALLMADRAELEALAADAQCVYRTQAGQVLELLKSFGEVESERLESAPAQMPGVCRECGCTDECACQPPCWWVDDSHTLCSACAYRAELAESTEILLAGVPAEGGGVTRESLAALIGEGFNSGALAAFQRERTQS